MFQDDESEYFDEGYGDDPNIIDFSKFDNTGGRFFGLKLSIQFNDGEIVSGLISIPKDELGDFDPIDFKNTLSKDSQKILSKYATLWVSRQKILKYPHLQYDILKDPDYLEILKDSLKHQAAAKAVEEIFSGKG